MFHTYQLVLLPGKRHAPGLALRHFLAKHVGAVVDNALEPRLVVEVSESSPADPVLHLRRLFLVPWLAREEVLHTNIMYRFII